MAKSKERSEVEHLRAVVRQQRSIIKNLKKQLTRQNKNSHKYDDLAEREAEALIEEEFEEQIKIKQDKCPQCGDKIEAIPLGTRVLLSCIGCNWRKTKKA